ncbi:MAG: HEAT repeat domain-containing protein [Candidatus Eremiobacteraeota bacterium]|nr:HEAT repeat domain-containing protein [Candidatus Eremiobacteraeota bacterium]
MKSENPVLEKWIDRGKRGLSGISGAEWRKKLTDGADPPDQVAALAALQSINKLSYSDLERVLESPHWLIRWAAAEALGNIGDPRAVEPLISALKDGYSNVCARHERSLSGVSPEPRRR